MITMDGALPPEKEIEKLREAYDSLNDVQGGLDAALSQIDLMNFGLAKDQLKSVQWHLA